MEGVLFIGIIIVLFLLGVVWIIRKDSIERDEKIKKIERTANCALFLTNDDHEDMVRQFDELRKRIKVLEEAVKKEDSLSISTKIEKL